MDITGIVLAALVIGVIWLVWDLFDI